MPQFSLKRLFVSVTLIAMGCALWTPFVGRGMVMLFSPFFIGAGIGNVFRRPILGGVLACVAIYALAVSSHLF
jgi:hypothetical protein